MNKTFLYLLLLICVGAAVYFLVLDTPYTGDSETAFTIRDSADVGKIFLADKQGNQILLEREEGGAWLLNGAYRPIPYNVEMLLTTLIKQTARYPVPQASHNRVIRSLAADGIKVEVYRHSGRKIKTFYVGGQSGSSDGSYMILEGADRPFVVGIMGVVGYLKPRYSTQLTDWRDRPVFRYKPEEIQSISIDYEDHPLNNFEVVRTASGQWELKAHEALLALGVREQRVQDFVGFFEALNHEGFLVGLPKMDSIIASLPRYGTVELVDRDGQAHALDVYWMPLDQRSKNLEYYDEHVKDGYDADRFYGVLRPSMDTVIIQHYSFGKVFRKAYEFVEESGETDAREQPGYSPDTVTHPRW